MIIVQRNNGNTVGCEERRDGVLKNISIILNKETSEKRRMLICKNLTN